MGKQRPKKVRKLRKTKTYSVYDDPVKIRRRLRRQIKERLEKHESH